MDAQTRIPRQGGRSYSRSLSEWLPPEAWTSMMAGNKAAARMISAHRRFSRFHRIKDWQTFIQAREEYNHG